MVRCVITEKQRIGGIGHWDLGEQEGHYDERDFGYNGLSSAGSSRNSVSLLCPFHTKHTADDPSSLLLGSRQMDGKRANMTVPGYLTHAPNAPNERLNAALWVLIKGAVGHAPQTPRTSSGARAPLCSASSIAIGLLAGGQLGTLAIGWDMMPHLRWSGKARNTLLSPNPSILADGCIVWACCMRETCKKCGRFYSDQDSAGETVMRRIGTVILGAQFDGHDWEKGTPE
ncbi:hypothetical protein EDB87DRAFT_1577516 [Lactarius vividus]|nr:hypothetical protein EDB87DRAFT_1577516 [Lactarius vividus]